ncbi:MAG: hypothetical protein ABWZ25_17430 [Chitinophagaceae bacterium]
MGLNDIRLSASSLVDLYPSSLVNLGDVPAIHLDALPVGDELLTFDFSEENRPTAFIAAPSPEGKSNQSQPQAPLSPEGKTKQQPEPVSPEGKTKQQQQPEPVSPEGKSNQSLPPAPASPEGKIVPRTPPTATVPSESIPWKFLGNNKKQVLIVVSYEGAAYLPDEELSFLTKMLGACKLSLDDVAIVNSAFYPAARSSDYLRFFRSKVLFLFGPDPASFGLPLSFPHYQVQSFAGTTFLYTPALEERLRDELFKSKLWVCLKRIFNL